MGERYAEMIRRLVRLPDDEAAALPPADERRLVAAVEQALRARARRRALVRRATGATFAAAAALAVVAGWRVAAAWRPFGGTPAPAVVEGERAPRALTVLGPGDTTAGAVVAGESVALKRGMPVGVGLTLRAPASGEVRVGTADGTSLALEAGGELTVTEAGATQRFALERGAVSARVERLFAGERFIVDTRDAEIEVHGTAFRVAIVPGDVACGGGTTTRVSVVEGVVSVRAGGQEVNVPAGGAWPDGCSEVARASAERRSAVHPHLLRVAREHAAPAEAATAAVPAPVPAAPAPVAAAAALAPAAAPAPAVVPPVAARPVLPASSLAAENDLFAAAVHAKKQGRLDEAARLFEELATSHPGSPLVESALVQRMKILATIDPPAGARAAATYLERYPGGFARPEAEALAGHPSP
jgi:hypothetical protein